MKPSVKPSTCESIRRAFDRLAASIDLATSLVDFGRAEAEDGLNRFHAEIGLEIHEERVATRLKSAVGGTRAEK